MHSFVADDSQDAAKDSSGVCIVCSDTAAPSGQCERKETCYWAAPVAGQARARKYTDAEAAKSQEDLQAYLTTLGVVLAPGIVLGVLNLIVMIFVVLCRCCCRRCGGKPKDDGYSKCQRFTPVVFYVVSPLHLACGVHEWTIVTCWPVADLLYRCAGLRGHRFHRQSRREQGDRSDHQR
jgi:hypothetical protein